MKRDLIGSMAKDMKDTKAKTTKAKTTKPTIDVPETTESTAVLLVAYISETQAKTYTFKDMDTCRKWFKNRVAAHHGLQTFTNETKKTVIVAQIIFKPYEKGEK